MTSRSGELGPARVQSPRRPGRYPHQVTDSGLGALTIRPITGPRELELFCRLSYVLDDELAGDLDAGRRRPEWMWIALRRGRVVARAAWWRRESRGEPALLDVFDIADDADDPGRVEVGAQLLEAALATIVSADGRPPPYVRFIPPDWREDAGARRIVEHRVATLERLGARLLVERLRLEWQAGTPISAPSRRLEFRPVADRAELVELMTRALDGTLDAHSREALRRGEAAEVAADHYDSELAGYSSPHEWWRVATLADGEPVGFVIPARNAYNPIIAYIGVVPTHRGKGYIDDILAEGTRILAEQGAPRIRASTDLDNAPMAAAFERNGYVVFERQLDMTWGSGDS